MDIVLNAVFNNPRLPIVPVPGFLDDFNRPAADTLGTTVDGKPWVVHDYGNSPSVWGTFGNGRAGMKEAIAQRHFAVVDALVPDGTLTARVGSIDTTDRRTGIALRYVDLDNYLVLLAGTPLYTRLTLEMRLAGSYTVLARNDDVALAAGDTITVTLNGPTIRVDVNGTERINAQVPDLTTATRHGLYGFATTRSTWDSIEFTP